MCGISGFNWTDNNLINKMNNLLEHRGPDDQGTYLDENISLGHTRLSIIDLTKKGHQPMFNDDRTLLIIYNGEIYNYKELRIELKKKGYSFFSESDTEVLLKSYQEWKEKCLSKLNGMFAFCIYDIRKQKLFMARDRFGIKPFYYYLKNGKIIFASEIKAILCHGIERRPNDRLIYDYLMFNIVDHTPETFFDEIMKLPKGYYGIYNLNKKELNLISYYDLKKNCRQGNELSYDEATQKFRKLFEDSVKLRLRSDVPVGSCLSGGLDSSSIVSLMNEFVNNKNISTFSAVYPGFEKDESYYIDKLIEKIRIKNKKTNPTANDLLADIEDFIFYQDEPTRSTSQYAQYCVMRLASKNNFKVLLDGQGSDEMLAGYHYFYGYYFFELLKKIQFVTLIREFRFYNKNINSRIGINSLGFLLLPKNLKEKYFCIQSPFVNHEFQKIWRKKSNYITTIIDGKGLKHALYTHMLYKLEELLKWEDRNSMAFSVETRVPFLDHNLVEFTLSLPSRYIIKRGMSKAILREAMVEQLDKEILNRTDKIGFETPEDEWLREEPVQGFVKEIINSKSFENRKYFDVERIRRDFELHLLMKKNIGMKIWQCIFLELWLRQFIDKVEFNN